MQHFFFLAGSMLKQANNIVVTLVPKAHNASNVKDFRPIACCTVIYKLISKILTNRMQAVIGDVVNSAQTGFIPDFQVELPLTMFYWKLS